MDVIHVRYAAALAALHLQCVCFGHGIPLSFPRPAFTPGRGVEGIYAPFIEGT
jgi:hypothetical protein